MTGRTLYWSIRRELWEHRALYIAPLAAAAVVVVGYVLGARGLARHLDRFSDQGLMTPYSFLAMATIVVGFFVSVSYCLSALHGERRDRSVLFWKSLPVSDLTTVLAKAAMPLIFVPCVVVVGVIASHLVMLTVGTAVAMGHGLPLDSVWSGLTLPQVWVILLWGMLSNALWHAPVFAWLLLVSGWAKRTPFLWALAVPFAVTVIEGIAFDSSVIRAWLFDRVVGGPSHAFDPGMDGQALQLAPAKFLSTPGLWLGLALAAVFLAAAVWQRRRREPT